MMSDDNIPKTSVDNAVDNDPTNVSPGIVEPKDGNGVANKPTPPLFSAEATTIPPTEELFSKQEDDVSSLILKLPQTRVPEFSVNLFRRRQMDWSRYKKAIGSTTGARSEAALPNDKEIKSLQTTALMGAYQFNRTVGYTYMRKSLALMYHQNSLIKNLNSNLVSLGKILEAKLEAIKLNSATPESKKAGFLAKFKNEFRDQSVKAVVSNLRGRISDVALPIVNKYVTNPIATNGADFFSGKINLTDIVKNLQMGLRNASETIAEKLSRSAEDEDIAPDVTRRFSSLADKFSAAGDRIGKYTPSETAQERMERASNWIRSHSPSKTISSIFEDFLTDAPGASNLQSDDVSGSERFVVESSPEAISFYSDSRDYYTKSLALLSKLAGNPVSTNTRPKKRESEIKKYKRTKRSSRTKSTRHKTPPKTSSRKNTTSSFKKPSRHTTISTPPKNTIYSHPVAPIKRSLGQKNTATPPNVIHLSDGAVRHTLANAVVPHVIPLKGNTVHSKDIPFRTPHDHTEHSHIADIIEPVKQATASLDGHGTFSFNPADAEDISFTDIDDEGTPKNSLFSSLRDDLRRYASTTTTLLKGFFKHDKEVSDSTNSVSQSFASVKDTLLKFVPKSFRKNSYDEEVLKDDKEEASLHETETQTQRDVSGQPSGLAGLFAKLFNRDGKNGESSNGESAKGWLDTLLDLGELGEDATMMTLLKRGLGRSKVGRAALTAGRIFKKPLSGLGSAVVKGGRYAKNAISNHGLIGGGLRIGGSALLGGAKLTGKIIKSPLSALAKIDKNIMRPMDAKAMSLLGSAGRGLESVAKGILTSKGTLVGLGGMAVNNLTDHVTNKNSIWNRLGHTTGNAMEWGATGATIGAFLGPEGALAGAAIGVAASTFITNIDLLGKGITAAGHGLNYLYHGIVGQDPVIDPVTGKLLKPGKHGLLTGLAFASQYTQDQLLGKMKPKYALDPSRKPWVNPDASLSPYDAQSIKNGVNPSATIKDPKTLKQAFSNPTLSSSSASTLSNSLLNGQKVTDQKEYKSAYQILPVYIQKKLDGSKALQFVLWGTSLVNGPKDAAKIFNDNYTEDETEETYIRKIYQTRGTRFGGKSEGDKQKAFRELGQEQTYADAVSSGATPFSFSQANSIVGSPVKPLADGSGDMSAYYKPHPKPTSAEVNKRAVEAINFFKSKGWTAEQAAGIVGNLIQESGLDPHVRPGDNGTAIGLAQWHPDRRTQIAAAMGKSVESMNFEEQLAAVDWELHNDERGAGIALKKAKTAAQAGQIVSFKYERPGMSDAVKAQEAANRGGIATNILGIYTKNDGKPPSANGPSTTGSTSATTDNGSGASGTGGGAGGSTATASNSAPSPTNGVIATAPIQTAASTSPSTTAAATPSSSATGDVKTPEAPAASNPTPTTSFTQKTTGPVIMRTPSSTPSAYDIAAHGEFAANVNKAIKGDAYNPNDRTGQYAALAQSEIRVDGLNEVIDKLGKIIAANTPPPNNNKPASKGDTVIIHQSHSSNTIHNAHNDIDISKPGLKPVHT